MSAPDPPVSALPGCVVLAAYRPDPDLFRVQLESIRDQTRTDWRCLVGADSGQDEVRRLVADIVGDDPRFSVIGWDDNVGFYRNFERLLAAVPGDVGWVALSDQDDRWYPDKLARLVPLLDDVALVTGQARVVMHPGNQVLLASTERKVVPAEDLLFENQVTGAFSVIRRDLLELALPFPRLHAVTQLHDHWLGMCAATTAGYQLFDAPLQDYVQHGGNLVGEIATHRGWTPFLLIRRIIELADTYEGGHSPIQCARACQVQSFEWRRVMLLALAARNASFPTGLERANSDLAGASIAGPFSTIARATRSENISGWVIATFIPGIPGEILQRLQLRRSGANSFQRPAKGDRDQDG